MFVAVDLFEAISWDFMSTDVLIHPAVLANVITTPAKRTSMRVKESRENKDPKPFFLPGSNIFVNNLGSNGDDEFRIEDRLLAIGEQIPDKRNVAQERNLEKITLIFFIQ
jgi:hypothetical protein